MRRLTLSQAIRRGTEFLPGRSPRCYIDLEHEGSCPLGAAFVGSLHGPADVQKFYTLVRNSSDESIAEFLFVGVMKAFPVLGVSVRFVHGPEAPWGKADRLPQYLERERVLAPRKQLSLFHAIAVLHDKLGWHKDQVSGLLARCEL